MAFFHNFAMERQFGTWDLLKISLFFLLFREPFFVCPELSI